VNEALKIFRKDSFPYEHALAVDILSSIYSDKYSMFQDSFPYFNLKAIDRVVNLIREALSLIKRRAFTKINQSLL